MSETADCFLRERADAGATDGGDPMKLRTPPPNELIDPDGEGVYLLDDWQWGSRPSVLRYAAGLFFDDLREYRNVEHQTVYMVPGDDDHWYPARTSRVLPRYWRLNLPKRYRPVAYAYCTPKAER